MIAAEKTNIATLVDALATAGVDFVASLPDSRIAPLIARIEQDERFTHVGLTSEDEGVGVCAGAYFGGKKPCLLIQNSGLLEATNDLVTLALFSQIPMLLAVAYRGHIGEPHWYHGLVGRVTEPVLQALGLKYVVLDDAGRSADVFAGARLLAESSSAPVAVLLTLSAIGSAK
jgi:sulfopyruvate decarboxylase subunit alpha